MPSWRTRLAPSPTGALHLGNARTFFVNWLMARQEGWDVVLRIEDLDGPRVKADAQRQTIEDLRWLGLDWDEGPVCQSARRRWYEQALGCLRDRGHIYPCVCSRAEVDRSASAPHAEDGSEIYSGACRGKYATAKDALAQSGRAAAMRFDTTRAGRVKFTDAVRGEMDYQVDAQLGDFVVARRDGSAAYQLAVVVDDAAMNITHVVRGDDLLDSTPRQILLYQAMGLEARIPAYFHLPLVVGTDGRRLAKRHGDTRLASYRDAGVPARRILRLLATWSGMDGEGETASDYVGRFELGRLPRGPITLTHDEERALCGDGGVR